ncbi:efflux RND transporter periplasmic adaptor subunit [Marinimicrobium locisalis]|uniref:efflux RND transporter periplasmic adaptor subunit n=1 Tax=Marinimicrobium locisalis TaxID=546022 RepID=UPI003221B402
MLKKIVLPLGITAVGVAVIVLLVAAKPEPTPRPPAEEAANVSVAVTEAHPETLRLSVQAQGSVMPKREIDLVAEVSGRVTRVDSAFVEGGFFEGDQTLLEIDDRNYQAALLEAQSRVADAEQRLAEERGRALQAQREWRDLGDENANNLFMRKPQVAAAEASLASARGALEVARLNVARTRITVPFSGRVRQMDVDLGEYVAAGTRLGTVYDSQVMEVRLPLTEQQAALIDLPLTSQSRTQDQAPIAVTVRGSVAGKAQQWQGQLVRTDAFVDADSRLYYAVVEVNEPFAPTSPEGKPRAPLLPGLFVEAEIQGKELKEVVKLPRAALFERDKLLVLDSDNRVSEQRVTVLHKTDSSVWVQSSSPELTRVTLEKQSLTPAGTLVDPVISEPSAPSEENSGAIAAASAATTSQSAGERKE